MGDNFNGEYTTIFCAKVGTSEEQCKRFFFVANSDQLPYRCEWSVAQGKCRKGTACSGGYRQQWMFIFMLMPKPLLFWTTK